MKKHELLEQVYKSNLPSRAKQVMFYLINRANGEGTCFPSIKTIASDCGVSTRTIQRTMVILLEAGFVKKDSRFREKGGQTSNLYTLAYPSQNNEDKCEKEFKEEEVKTEEKQKSDNCEEIETVSFFDYKTSDDSISETINDKLLEEKNKVINDIPGLNYKGDISAIPIECHSIFMKLDRAIKNVSCKNLIDNMQCHGEGDNLYPP
ncbi:helix-turn-helix domain-containing protein [Clostridium sp. 19966]|uniref:Firmicute plasmid replication protein (RepL) n=1 Tax=Clostridium butyricum TaxID=1492 RepID=A0A6N2ZZN7_CLOBU|nr:helix-turn-helix domain-containing protein [Clostridium sp. 19966]MDT8717034.1 helix-turn-helix domain-containing protein [Clostridium sp. 19966]